MAILVVTSFKHENNWIWFESYRFYSWPEIFNLKFNGYMIANVLFIAFFFLFISICLYRFESHLHQVNKVQYTIHLMFRKQFDSENPWHFIEDACYQRNWLVLPASSCKKWAQASLWPVSICILSGVNQ